LARGDGGEHFKLSLMLEGSALIVQDDREAVLAPGDFAIYDCDRPYTLHGADGFRMVVCLLPHVNPHRDEVLGDETGDFRIGIDLGIQPSTSRSGRGRAEVEQDHASSGPGLLQSAIEITLPSDVHAPSSVKRIGCKGSQLPCLVLRVRNARNESRWPR